MILTKEFVNNCRSIAILRDFLCQAIDQVDAMDEERRWRKFPEEKPSEELEGEDFLVSNGYYQVVCEWRGYWNNEPFLGDRNCEEVKFWTMCPKLPEL